MAMPRIAIVAAMEREVAPLIRSWQSRWIERDGRRYKLFENGDASLICGGIGAEAARRATEVIIRESQPDRVLSVGFAGALDPALTVGQIVEPRIVIDASDGARIDTGHGDGTLISFANVAGPEQKRKLREAYGAAVVDMESVAVSRGAEIRGLSFGALKVVSDDARTTLPPVEGFVAADGSFRARAFAFHAALRPWLWRATVVLARNSAKASHALCQALEEYVKSSAAATLAARR